MARVSRHSWVKETTKAAKKVVKLWITTDNFSPIPASIFCTSLKRERERQRDRERERERERETERDRERERGGENKREGGRERGRMREQGRE